MIRIVRELSAYLPNKPGTLASVSKRLAEKGVNIKAIEVYEGHLQSLSKIVVDQDKIEIAEQILRDCGVELISSQDVIEFELVYETGCIAWVTEIFGQYHININAIYASAGDNKTMLAYIHVSDIQLALKILHSSTNLNSEKGVSATRRLKKNPISSHQHAIPHENRT